MVCPPEAITEVPREIGTVMEGQGGCLQFVSGRLNVGEAMAVPLIREVKKQLGKYTDIIIDAPPGTACPMVEAISDTDHVLLVTEPTPFGLNDLKLAVETTRKLELPHSVIINRADSGDRSVREFCDHNNIPVISEIPDDRRVAESYSKGEMIYRILPEFRKYFEAIVERIDDLSKIHERSIM